MEINTAFQGGVIDSVVIEPCGLLGIYGWYGNWNSLPKINVSTPEGILGCVEIHRCLRQDVNHHLGSDNCYLGFEAFYKIYDLPFNTAISITLSDQLICNISTTENYAIPHYQNLLNSESVYSRDDIYGYGPPINFVPEDIKNLSGFLHGKILDFGCGSGAFVEYLRTRDYESFGIEINRPAIQNAIKAELNSFITLYNGDLPLPFKDNEFDFITAIEVIEHVSDYEKIIKELSRVSKIGLMITVPDMSAIPRCFPQNVVPWHLLESTHINFFNQQSLNSLLSKYFSKIYFVKIGKTRVNQSTFYTSIVAICEK